MDALEIKYERQLDCLDGLIIPGGESTTIARLKDMTAGNLLDSIRRLGEAGFPIYGTCMGTIMLARKIIDSPLELLALMDISVSRNAYGPQKASFEADIDIPCLKELGAEELPFPAVFIRAPMVLSVKTGVEILARFEDAIVMARQDNFLVTTFHPEITDDFRVHEYFAKMVNADSLKSPQKKCDPVGERSQAIAQLRA